MKGLYLFPLQIPPGGKWGPNPDWVLAQFMDALGVPYQVSGLWAFHRYGLSEQLPSGITVYNTKLSGKKIIGKTAYDFIKVDPKRLGSTNLKVTTDNSVVVFSSAARSLFDAFYDWHRFGTIPKVFNWVAERVDDKKLITDLIKATALYGNVGTARRVGYTLAHLGVSKNRLKKLQDIASDTASFIALEPSKIKRGPIDKTWGLIVNNKVGG
jgi:predicted transcriptional regulator of viral defense system